MKPATLRTKWQTQKFTAANYDKIDDTYLAEFAGDVAQTILDAGGPAASGWTSVNASNSLLKAFRYWTRGEVAANGNFGQAFEELDYSTCCIQTKVLVEKYQPDPAVPMVFNQVLVAVWDKTAYGKPERYVHVDGSFREGDTTPAKFVPIDSPAAKYGYLRRYDPATTDWAYGELTIFEQNGTDYFATAQVAGGPLGVPDIKETPDWKPAAAPQQASLLSQNNAWTGINYYEKGLRLPLGGFVDENGHFYIRQVDVGQKHFTFGKYYSLAQDALIQWKADLFINQDGNGDVGLGRADAGVLEVNTGTAGQLARLNVLDVLVSSVQNIALNTFSKLAAYVANLGLRAGATTTTDPATPTSWIGNRASLRTTDKTSIVSTINELVTKITFAGFGMVKTGNLIGLQQSVANLPLPGFENVGLISDTDGTLVTDNDFAKGYRYSPFIALDPAGGPLTFAGGRADFGAFYDKNFAFIRKINNVGFPANSYEAGIAYMRLSYPEAQYPKQTYSLGSLGYVRALRKADGTLLTPDQSGQIDVSSLASAGGGGASYTDAQARAAQLGRSAPANTTTVTLTAEAPTDYGTIASGAFTIDATSCVVGKCVRFAVATGGSAPAFTNPPSGQPYKYLGATYASGQAYSYSLLVCVDRIEVVTLND